MYPLFETIKIQNGKPQNLDWHQKRMDESSIVQFGMKSVFDLTEIIRIPMKYAVGTVKLRLEYNAEKYKLKFVHYNPKKINKFKIVECNDINYQYKFTDRSAIEDLMKLKGECDEIIIVKNGVITDTSFSNIIFWDGANWKTPATPLLNGTKRRQLIHDKKIIPDIIKIEDLNKFSHFKLINAMLDYEESEVYRIGQIM